MRVIILHGTGEDQNSFWLPYTKKRLEQKRYEVMIPLLPDTDDPILSEQLKRALEETYTEDTILIGHSSGSPLILSILENIPTKIKSSIHVAGYASRLKVLSDDTKNLQERYDWKKIKDHCKEFIFINAVNDPWGADDTKGREMFDHLGGTLIINNEGHMGSDSFNQPYKEFPFLLKLID